MRVMEWFVLGALSLGALACERSSGSEAAGEPSVAEQAAQRGTPEEATPTAAPEAPAPAAMRVHYDLARHLERAEIFHGDVHVMDLGVPGGAKHFLGGWQTLVGDDATVDGTPAVVVPGPTARFLLWAEPAHASGAVLTLRVRAPGAGKGVVYVNGETLTTADVPRDGFGLARMELREGLLRAGMNVLQVRVPAVGAVERVGRVGLLVDWIRLGAADGPEPPEPPRPDRLRAGDAANAGLRVPEGWAVAHTLRVPEGARLRADVQDGALDVRLERDGQAPVQLTTGATGKVDVDLGRFAGEVARIRLGASAGQRDAVLAGAAVMVPDARALRALTKRPRHVLVYLIDTLRADKLKAYNPDTRVQTPGFTRHASLAALFTRGHTQENWTKPSVATLLTSLMPWEHHATTGEAVLPASVEMLPETLRGHGYFTGAFIANGYVSGKFGFEQGWHTWRNYIREGRRTQARFVAADVLEWLDRRPEDKPFFLYVHTIDPHVPYIPPDDLLAQYDPDPYQGPVDFTRDRQVLEKIKVGKIQPNDRDKRRLEALYDGEITYHDLHFASILDGLEKRGLLNETMVVVTADHGEELFDHGSVGHGHSVWQELLHVPLSMYVPGLTEGEVRVHEPVGLVDVMPTVLDALSLAGPARMSGRSLLPLLMGAHESAPRATVSGFMQGWRAAMVGDLKVVHRTHATVQLYDLAADPGETSDLASDKPLATRYMQGMLGLALRGAAGQPAPTHRAQTTTIDPATEAQLRALGYVGTSRK
jgi:choline-sulfatase